MTAGTGPAPVWYPLPTTTQAAASVAAAFTAEYGHPPDGVWAAPGRVNVIGEHVDYNDGLCLPFALPQRTFVALSGRRDDTVRIRSLQIGSQGRTGSERQIGIEGTGAPTAPQRPDDHEATAVGACWEGPLATLSPGGVSGWAGYAVGVPWALEKSGLAVPGFDAVIDGYVPLGSGLSSSAAVECALAVALDGVAGWGLADSDEGRIRLAAACVRAENEMAGAPTGGLDQAAALRCRRGAALLLDCRDFSAVPVPFDLAAAGLELLVIDTRAHHSLGDGQYGQRRAGCERACRVLQVRSLREVDPRGLASTLTRLDRVDAGLVPLVRHVVSEIDRVQSTVELLRAGRVRRIGPLLDASHASLRDDYRVSCPELDLACEAARRSGALGARMVGGGFGGSAIALVDTDRVDAVAAAVSAAFASAGFGAPAFLRAVPSDAAARVG